MAYPARPLFGMDGGYHDSCLADSSAAALAIPAGGSATVPPATGMAGSDVRLVAVLAGVSSASGGVVTAYPSAATAPVSSTMNLLGGRSVSNTAVVKTGTGGTVTFAVGGTSVNLAVFCDGYFADA